MSGYYWSLKVKRKSYNPDQPRVPAGESQGGQWTSGAGGGGRLSLDEVSKRIKANLPSGQTYRGISKEQFAKVRGGEPLTSRGERMLAQAGKPGELQTTNNLMQALAHAGDGVVIALPKNLTSAKPQFADIRKVKGDRLDLSDITVVFDAQTGETIYEKEKA